MALPEPLSVGEIYACTDGEFVDLSEADGGPSEVMVLTMEEVRALRDWFTKVLRNADSIKSGTQG